MSKSASRINRLNIDWPFRHCRYPSRCYAYPHCSMRMEILCSAPIRPSTKGPFAAHARAFDRLRRRTTSAPRLTNCLPQYWPLQPEHVDHTNPRERGAAACRHWRRPRLSIVAFASNIKHRSVRWFGKSSYGPRCGRESVHHLVIDPMSGQDAPERCERSRLHRRS